MRKKSQWTGKTGNIFPLKIDELEKLMKNKFENNEDLIFSTYEHQQKKIALFYINYQTES
ncbi:hypothetical protein ACFQ3N_04125 [Virgibacillus byunsanensis]|uniref:Uncharacterized protein n=1 Tax=Virgibacillus byunsanensis TaxID=570945 RepID=A0ABW3LIW5_9BACI